MQKLSENQENRLFYATHLPIGGPEVDGGHVTKKKSWVKWISPLIVLFMSDYCVILLCFSASFLFEQYYSVPKLLFLC